MKNAMVVRRGSAMVKTGGWQPSSERATAGRTRRVVIKEMPSLIAGEYLRSLGLEAVPARRDDMGLPLHCAAPQLFVMLNLPKIRKFFGIAEERQPYSVLGQLWVDHEGLGATDEQWVFQAIEPRLFDRVVKLCEQMANDLDVDIVIQKTY